MTLKANALPSSLICSPNIVLDTNVVIALWVFGDPGLSLLRQAIEAARITLFTQTDCLEELQRVLRYPQFALSEEAQQTVFAHYTRIAQCLPGEVGTQEDLSLPQCKDKDDQKFIQLAWRVFGACLLTRDKLLLKLARNPVFRDRLLIITPEVWLKMQASDEQDSMQFSGK